MLSEQSVLIRRKDQCATAWRKSSADKRRPDLRVPASLAIMPDHTMPKVHMGKRGSGRTLCGRWAGNDRIVADFSGTPDEHACRDCGG